MTWRTPTSSWRASRAETTSLRRSRRSELPLTASLGSRVGCVGAGGLLGSQGSPPWPPHCCWGSSSTKWNPSPLILSPFSSPPLTLNPCKLLPSMKQEVVLFCTHLALQPIDHVTLGNFLGLSGPQHPPLSSEELVMEGEDTLAWWLGEPALMSSHPTSSASCTSL